VKVIGAGFGRTGTLSIKAALEELGFGPCYHMSETHKNPDHRKVWGSAARGEPVDWREVLKGYEATMDWPWCTYYKELMRAFPDAKVLLSVRDPEEWYESTITTIYSMYKISRYISHGPAPVPAGGGIGIWGDTFSGHFEDREQAIAVFERHNEEVVRHVPPERLLVYEAKEGWGPLCEFLGVGVPEGLPFPHLNGYATIWNLPDKKEQARETQQRLRDGARGRDLQDGQSVPVAAPLKTDLIPPQNLPTTA
jgi:hypothetical protein